MQTGGRHFPADTLDGLPAIASRLARELRNEYLLGYSPARLARDGKYHSVKLLLDPSIAASGLRTYYKRGYYGPNE
jgi:hypothetical protein